MSRTQQLTRMAILSAIAMVIFVIEAQIPLPIPLPGIKLGLANIITLFALYTLGRRQALAILLLRVVVGNLVIGAVMAMLYSLAGGLLCWLVLSLLRPFFSLRQVWVMSIFGALAHNAGQLAVAILLTGTPALLSYAPALILAALVTGFFTGQAAQAVLLHREKLHL